MTFRSCFAGLTQWWMLLVVGGLNSQPVLLAQDSETKVIHTIAFGSCAREREPQPVWESIIASDPDLFLMIGDNHYADFWLKDGKMVMEPVPGIERIQEAYAMLGKQPGFQKLRAHCPLLATWDDHDYGANDMGNDFRLRAQSQNEFVKFYGFPPGHPIREQAGVYHTKTFGPEGRRVQIILLDTRYHRDPLAKRKVRLPGVGPYGPSDDSNTTMLGQQQWAWLERQLKQPAEVRILASSIQVVADEHGWETWGNMPHERKRLYELIHSTGAKGAFFVSGDRHLLELSCDKSRGGPYPMWDFTSSGLTQRTELVRETNRYRIGPVTRTTNFGLIHLEWGSEGTETKIHLEGRDKSGQLLTRQTIFLSDLQQ